MKSDIRFQRMPPKIFSVPSVRIVRSSRLERLRCEHWKALPKKHGDVRSGEGRTDLFIWPPYRFRVVDHVLTNFHLPRSTLLALVMALGGVDAVRRAYQHAIQANYRFYSYGDAMLVRNVRKQ